MICPTVRIQANNEDGFTDINESDLDEKSHKLYSDKPEKKTAQKEIKKESKKAE